MTDIWERVTNSLTGDLNCALQKVREQPQFKLMESEIERAFAAHFVIATVLSGEVKLSVGMPEEEYAGFFLAPQVVIGDYRVDFVFARGRDFRNPRKWVVIECDGHDFHERTKEQASRDKSRDRYLSTQVSKVLRFTGSEIYRDVAACWVDVARVFKSIEEDE